LLETYFFVYRITLTYTVLKHKSIFLLSNYCYSLTHYREECSYHERSTVVLDITSCHTPFIPV